jgi:hypothetical protein
VRSSLAPVLALLAAACGSQVDDRDTAGVAPRAPTTTSPAPSGRPAAPERPVILAELFTSQGCSSCPPADRLLSSIRDLAPDGAEVIPLAFHVDYWDDLGWKDPFSAAEWTERQRRYALRVSGGRVYTPMLVVQGRAHMVGSSQGEIEAALQRAARDPATGAAIAGQANGGKLTIDASAGGSRATAFVALVESGIDTTVERGENQGRVLRNDFIVRRLSRAFDLAANERKSETVDLALDASWRRERVMVILFLQDPESLAIEAAARATIVP